MRGIFAIVSILILISGGNTRGAIAQSAFQLNTQCSMQNVLAPYANLKLENVSINCGNGAEPQTALKVNYYWMDAISASLLLSGRRDARLSSLLGDKPIVMNNEVTESFADLQQRFGVTIGSHSLFSEHNTFIVTYVEKEQNRAKFENQDLTVLRSTDYAGLRIFDGSSTVYWPDALAAQQMMTTPYFPRMYRHYVRAVASNIDSLLEKSEIDDFDLTQIVHSVLLSRVFYKPITREDLLSYEKQLVQMRAIALSGAKIPQPFGTDLMNLSPRLPQWNGDNDKAYETEIIRRLPELGKSRTIAALQYISREGLPEDFISAFGLHEAHGDSEPMWSLMAFPRRLFMRIAVIENAATTPTDYSLSEFIVARATKTQLRKISDSTSAEPRSLQFVQSRLSHRERVVIPLSLEFRDHRSYDAEEGPSIVESSPASFATIRNSLAQIPYDSIPIRLTGDQYSRKIPPKQKSLFATNDPPAQPERSYLYGPSYELQFAVLEKLKIKIRSAQPAGIYRVAGFEGGSCPILYYRTHGSKDWIKIGSVLRTAVGQDRQSVEQYELPLDVSEISIVEEEPEISWIKRFSVIATDTAGHVRDLATSEGPFYLEFGQTKALSVPPALPGEKVAVSVDGYFIPYSMLIGSHVKRSAADPG